MNTGHWQNWEVQLLNQEFVFRVYIWEPPCEIGRVGITAIATCWYREVKVRYAVCRHLFGRDHIPDITV